jgi:peptidyl-prolyl cis-trans isomerase B (cyclophilin B)
MPKPNAAALQKAAEKVDLTAGPFQVVLETTMGMIRLDLDAKVAPGHVRNMVALAESGFYDGTGFQRIIKGFMIQGGCPEGTGTGGPGYRIPAEFNATPHEPGVLSMARTNDPNSAGSQFFICLGKATHLDRNYTAFGRAADDASLQVVRAIGDVATGPNDRPRQPVTITKATVTRLQAP